MLIAEDNFAELKLFEIAAQESGLTEAVKLDTANDGEEVILKLIGAIEKNRPYKLLLLDLNMPRVSGKEVLQHILNKKLHPKPFIIMLTNSDRPEDRDACLTNGADAFIQKPTDFYEIEDFCKTIKNCIELKHGISAEFIRMNYNGVH